MGYIEKSLLSDEQIIYRTKKHFIIFLIPVIWTLAILPFLLNSNPYIVKLAPVIALAALITWIHQLLNYISSDYVLTNKRIIMKEGFFFRHANELRLPTVSNTNVDQGPLGMLLDYGNVVIAPFGGGDDRFFDIAHPNEFKKQTQAQLDKLTTTRPGL